MRISPARPLYEEGFESPPPKVVREPEKTLRTIFQKTTLYIRFWRYRLGLQNSLGFQKHTISEKGLVWMQTLTPSNTSRYTDEPKARLQSLGNKDSTSTYIFSVRQHNLETILNPNTFFLMVILSKCEHATYHPKLEFFTTQEDSKTLSSKMVMKAEDHRTSREIQGSSVSVERYLKSQLEQKWIIKLFALWTQFLHARRYCPGNRKLMREHIVVIVRRSSLKWNPRSKWSSPVMIVRKPGVQGRTLNACWVYICPFWSLWILKPSLNICKGVHWFGSFDALWNVFWPFDDRYGNIHTHQLHANRNRQSPYRLRLFYIPLQSVLYRWRQSSSTTCQYCVLDDETAQHFLTDCENWSRERRLCGITGCDAYVILHGNNIADMKNLLKCVRLIPRLKWGMSIQWSITGSKSYIFARIRPFGLDPNKPSSSCFHNEMMDVYNTNVVYEKVMIWIDDTLVFHATCEDYRITLRRVFQRLVVTHVQFNPTKTDVCVQDIFHSQFSWITRGTVNSEELPTRRPTALLFVLEAVVLLGSFLVSWLPQNRSFS